MTAKYLQRKTEDADYEAFQETQPCTTVCCHHQTTPRLVMRRQLKTNSTIFSFQKE